MYKTITIGGKDYRMEFTMEASLCSECVEKTIQFITQTAAAQDINLDGLTDDEAGKALQNSLNKVSSGMSGIAKTAMSMWYAGFLEYHGTQGDRTVLSMEDAKNLFRKYHEEHPDDSSFFDIVRICTEQMGEDGFFKLIGLDKMLTPATRPKKVPQDHKRKKATETV